MANLPLRTLGEVGVIADANPYDLPLNAYSDCNNVVFNEGRISRAPVFKQLFPAIRSALSWDDATGDWNSDTNTYQAAQGTSPSDARFVGSFADPSEGEVVFVCDADNTIRSYQAGLPAIIGTGTVTNDAPWSHAQVSGLSFLAREGMKPMVRNIITDTEYSALGNDWGEADTAAVVRPYLDFAIMLNVTKGAQSYPTMVKWCNPLQYSLPVGDIAWDPTNTNYVAGENILGDLRTSIRDGLVLGNMFILYAQDQVWMMEYTGSDYVFNFRRLFPTGGIINTNCVVEVEGKHYVFGDNDIYVHDGSSMQSIAVNRVRRHIFKTLNRQKRTACFVVHDSLANLVHFCYNTIVDEAGFKDTQFCNKAATYNYRSNTWSFMDLPNVVGGAEANLDLNVTAYPQLGDTYDVYNTAYTAFTDQKPKITVMLSSDSGVSGLTESRVYGLDIPSYGLLTLPVEPEAYKPAYVERVGMDLDDAGLGLPIRSYKAVTSIVPQMSFDSSKGTFTWTIGSNDISTEPVVWRVVKDFDPEHGYKMDMNVAGRYLAYRVDIDTINNFRLSGVDMDVSSHSRR